MPKNTLKETLAVRQHLDANAASLKDQVIAINRVTKVVKGGKNLSFSALVVVGDQQGHAGFGMGKAREVPMAIRKGIEQAKKNMIKLNLKGETIPHQVVGHYGSGQVLLKPAPEGTGIIAGGPVFRCPEEENRGSDTRRPLHRSSTLDSVQFVARKKALQGSWPRLSPTHVSPSAPNGCPCSSWRRRDSTVLPCSRSPEEMV
jgi:hypothetical protein